MDTFFQNFFLPFQNIIPTNNNNNRTQNTQQVPVAPKNTPPASNWQLNNLPMVKITVDDLQEQSNKECMVCLMEHEVGKYACKLPCSHLFHRECLLDWLHKHSNCPICRYELETNDTLYEIERKKNIMNRKLRIRRDELQNKSISQLKELCNNLNINIQKCLYKIDIINIIIDSNKIIIIENVPTKEIDFIEFESMSVKELQHLLLSFGISSQNIIEKSELKQKLIDSKRIILINNIISISNENSIENESKKQRYNMNDNNNRYNKYKYTNNYETNEKLNENNNNYNNNDNTNNKVNSNSNSNENENENQMENNNNINNNNNESKFIDLTNHSNNQTINSIATVTSTTNQNQSHSHQSGVTMDSLNEMSLKELKSIALGLNVSLNGCLEKYDISQRIMAVI